MLEKLRTRFIDLYKIETSVVFSRNKFYILMFDLLSPEQESPTLPLDESGSQIIIDNVEN